MRNFICIFLFLGTSLFSESKFIATPSFEEGARHVPKNAIIFLDLDSTLFNGDAELGTTQAFYDYYIPQLQSEGWSREEVLSDHYSIWLKHQNKASNHLVEATILSTIEKWKEEGHTVLGLTARQPVIAPKTLQILEELGIAFSKVGKELFSSDFASDFPALFAEGVLFAHDLNSKGEILSLFAKLKPELFENVSTLAFFDDRKKNVESVREAAKNLGKDYIGIWYTHETPKETELDTKICQVQERLLDTVLPDAAAEKLIATSLGKKLLDSYKNPLLTSPEKELSLTEKAKEFPPLPHLGKIDSKIIEAFSMKELLEEANERALFVFDINDTLLSSKTYLGSDRWAQTLIGEAILNGMSKDEATDRIVPFWHRVIMQSEYEPVEVETGTFLRMFQQRGAATIGLTARYIEMAYSTIDALSLDGIHLDQNDKTQRTLFTPYPAKVIGGVIFAGLLNDKGEVFKHYLQQAGHLPEKVVFFDDKLKNVESMQKACDDLGLPFLGVWYRACEQKQNASERQEVYQLQTVLFDRILPNEAARTLIPADKEL